jgi:hypothetical protein
MNSGKHQLSLARSPETDLISAVSYWEVDDLIKTSAASCQEATAI